MVDISFNNIYSSKFNEQFLIKQKRSIEIIEHDSGSGLMANDSSYIKFDSVC